MPIISPKIPQGLEELMRGLAKSVIKENPENIYEFAAEYFENLLHERDGTVDQSYKKFATYKVYKKNKMARMKRELRPSQDEAKANVEQGSITKQISDPVDDNEGDGEEQSIEKIILPETSTSQEQQQQISKDQVSISSESEINASVKQEAFYEDEGTPINAVNSEEDDVQNMVLDEEMAQAALKIQSTFRGHKVRREMKETKVSHDDEISDMQSNNSPSDNFESEKNAITEASVEDLCVSNDNVEVEGDFETKQTEIAESDAIEQEVVCLSEINQNVESDVANANIESAGSIKSETNDLETPDTEIEPPSEVVNVEIEKICEIEEGASHVENIQLSAEENLIQTNDDDDIANMVLDEEMEEAALKIQSAFRGHKVRKEMIPDKSISASIQDVIDVGSIDEVDVMRVTDPDKSALNGNCAISDEMKNLEQVVMESEAPSSKDEAFQSDNIEEHSIEHKDMFGQKEEEEKSIETVTKDDDENNKTNENMDTKISNEILMDDTSPGPHGDEMLSGDNTEMGELDAQSNVEDEKNINNSKEQEEEQQQEVLLQTELIEAPGGEEEGEEIADNGGTENSLIISSDEPAEKINDESNGEEINVNDTENLKEESLECEQKSVGGSVAASLSEEKIIAPIEDNVVAAEENLLEDNEAALGEPESTETDEKLTTKSGEATSFEKTIDIESQIVPDNELEIKDQSFETLPEQSTIDLEKRMNDDASQGEENSPIVEEMCEQKIIAYLEPDQNNESEKVAESEMQNEEIFNECLEKMPSTDIKYEKLQESIDINDVNKSSPEREAHEITPHTTDEESNRSSVKSKNSSSDDNLMAEPQMRTENLKLENILQESISPIELIDEVVNEKAAMKVKEMFENSTPVERNSQEIFDAITKPELVVLHSNEREECENEPIRDEILQPEGEEDEIPEHNENSVVEQILITEQSLEEEKATIIEPETNEEESTPSKNNDSDDIANMILDDEMEEAAIKIQAAFRGHQTRREATMAKKQSTLGGEGEEENDGNKNKLDSVILIEQCSEGNEGGQEQDDNEQQDTSADIEEIQESETAEQENNDEETQEDEAAVEEETAEETAENETNEQADEPEPEGECSGQAENNNDDDDDVANMVLDEEMEQAALKIQSTFRGHKTRKEIKTVNEDKTSDENIQNADEEIANLTLESENSETKEEEKEPQQEEASSSNEKTAQQLQEEEDIANLVMDDEMEKTALKIQSAFRGKAKRKGPKDGSESFESSAENGTESESGEEQSPPQSDETNNDMYAYFALNQEYGEEERQNSYEGDYSETANRQSYCDDMRYSMESYEGAAFDQTIYPDQSDEKIDYMHGGGIFPEPSDEYGTFEVLSGSSGEDRDPAQSNDDNLKRKASESLKSATINEEESLDEEKVIESFNFDTNKDSAEAMYYSLKKNEIEAQKQFSKSTNEEAPLSENEDIKNEALTSVEGLENETDDDDVVVLQSMPSANKKLKYGMSMDDRLLGSILSQEGHYIQRNTKKIYPDEYFDPLLEETMSSQNFLEKLHNISHSEEDRSPENFDPNDVGDEDQFDDFYPGNIRSKIMASSISIADSDYFDPTNNKSIIDDNSIKTALETIHSTDSESTIGSAATKIPVGDKNLITHRNNNIQYSSIGNAAIDKSLDDFIQSQELKIDRFDEEPEEYSSPPPRIQESVEDWTDDTGTESEKKPHVAGVIEIKLEQKHFLTVDERRRTLHREDAIQRSTHSEDSSRSSNASSEKIIDKSIHSDTIVTVVQGQDSIIDTEISVPVLEKPKSASPQKGIIKMPIRRQKTMPVQIESNVMRVLPKHLRKRIKSAESEKKKRMTK